MDLDASPFHPYQILLFIYSLHFTPQFLRLASTVPPSSSPSFATPLRTPHHRPRSWSGPRPPGRSALRRPPPRRTRLLARRTHARRTGRRVRKAVRSGSFEEDTKEEKTQSMEHAWSIHGASMEHPWSPLFLLNERIATPKSEPPNTKR